MKRKPKIGYWICTDCNDNDGNFGCVGCVGCVVKNINKRYWVKDLEEAEFSSCYKYDLCKNLFKHKKLSEGDYMLEML